MLRAISSIYLESQVLELVASATTRRDVSKILGIRKYSVGSASSQTVLTSDASGDAARAASGPAPAAPPSLPPPPPPPRPPRRAWGVAAAALAVTASLGGVYFYRKINDENKTKEDIETVADAAGGGTGGGETGGERDQPYPASADALPRHVDFLLVGGGTASFAAMRALRAARPEASVLIVGEEPLPPYMRPPLSKELWREPDLADADPATLSFRQWNGKRRPLLYEPLAFYAPIERLSELAREGRGAAALARGWRVARVHPERRVAELEAEGLGPVVVRYGRCLLAPGVRARRTEALRAARDAGRALAVRDARDAARLARELAARRDDPRPVVVVGGGLLGTELAASLAERGSRVVLLCREGAPLSRLLPGYLAAEAGARLRAAGARVRRGEVAGSAPAAGGGARLALADGAELEAALVVECCGAEADERWAAASGLETWRGALLATAELQLRAGLWAAGDAVSWWDPAAGRRRAAHHDHAVASGRRAGENMAGDGQRPYSHRPMFWSDLGAELGFEAIGVVDSSLPTVGVFSEADVAEAEPELAAAAVGAGGTATVPPLVEDGAGGTAPAESGETAPARRYRRGVVFYTRENRVVGVLLWNLFNRMHVARQVLAHGEFEDLFEVAKLFALHEDD